MRPAVIVSIFVGLFICSGVVLLWNILDRPDGPETDISTEKPAPDGGYVSDAAGSGGRPVSKLGILPAGEKPTWGDLEAISAREEQLAERWRRETDGPAWHGTALRTIIDERERSFTLAAFSADGYTLGLLLYDEGFQLREFDSGELAFEHRRPHWGYETIALSPRGEWAALKDINTDLEIHDLAREGPVRTIELSSSRERCQHFLPDGTLLTVGSSFDDIILLDPVTGASHGSILKAPNFVTTIATTPDGAFVAYVYHPRDTAVVLDRRTGVSHAFPCGEGLERIALTPDGGVLATAYLDDLHPSRLDLWDVKTGELLHRLIDGDEHIGSLAFSPDGSLLAATVGARLGWETLALWDVATGRRLEQDSKARAEEVIFSPGGKFLIGCGFDLKIWAVDELLDEELQRTFNHVNEKWDIYRQGGQLYLKCYSDELTGDDLDLLDKLPTVTGIEFNYGPVATDAIIARFAKSGRLLDVHLNHCVNLTSATLAHLQECQGLEALELKGLGFLGDADLQKLQRFPRLETLNLSDTLITDAGLAHLNGLTRVRTLNLGGVRGVTDKGLAHIANMTKMEELNLAVTEITDAGLTHFAEMKEMRDLSLAWNEPVTGEGFAHLKGMSSLRALNLNGTSLNDGGLAHLAGLTELRSLHLSETKVTDAGFRHLTDMTKLSELEVSDVAGLTGKGLWHLRGMTELTELDLSTTGVTDEGLAGIAELTQLTRLSLPNRITDAGLAHLGALPNLKSLGLYGFAGVKGPGLAHLAGASGLRSLHLDGTGVTDDSLKSLNQLKQLDSVSLPEQIGDAGMVHLAQMPNLTEVDLSDTKVTDEGIARLTALPELRTLYLRRTAITDAALKHLSRMDKLRHVYVTGTAVSRGAAEALKESRPDLTIEGFE